MSSASATSEEAKGFDELSPVAVSFDAKVKPTPTFGLRFSSLGELTNYNKTCILYDLPIQFTVGSLPQRATFELFRARLAPVERKEIVSIDAMPTGSDSPSASISGINVTHKYKCSSRLWNSIAGSHMLRCTTRKSLRFFRSR
jgi:hypothetical protein